MNRDAIDYAPGLTRFNPLGLSESLGRASNAEFSEHDQNNVFLVPLKKSLTAYSIEVHKGAREFWKDIPHRGK